jgi:hypothetical protein
MFITAFTSARHLSLSWATEIQSMPLHPTTWKSILILSFHLRLGLPSGVFLSDLSTKTLFLYTATICKQMFLLLTYIKVSVSKLVPSVLTLSNFLRFYHKFFFHFCKFRTPICSPSTIIATSLQQVSSLFMLFPSASFPSSIYLSFLCITLGILMFTVPFNRVPWRALQV